MRSRGSSVFLVDHIEIVQLEHGREITGRGGGVNRAFVPVLVKKGHKSAVIEMGMGKDNRIELG